ncbi:MAG: hypothetical protein U9Q81_23995 [Pseudomonadota bacterium]|nr:hypothetical protein [Pseudomonadota bacterium]
MGFDSQGNLEIYNEYGKKVEPDKRDLRDIIGSGKVVKAESITVLEVEGSCYRLVFYGGSWHVIPC